jgi:hypothetical protein
MESQREEKHAQWIKVANGGIQKTESTNTKRFTYHGSCQCDAVNFEFYSPSPIQDTTLYTCTCVDCSKRGYLLYVTTIKNFQFKSRTASDLGTFATETGITSLMF